MPETRPRTPGPPPPSPSFTSHQLREARAEAASLAAKNERLTAALTAARERIVELGAQLDAVTAPPVTLGLLTASPRSRGEGRPVEADVVLGGRPMRLGLHPGLDPATLGAGRLAAVNDQMLVVDSLPAPDTGEAVTLDEVLGARRALVTTGGGASRVLALAEGLDPAALKPGDTLVADLRADLATALVERTGVEQLVIAEAPDVSWADIGGLGPQIDRIRDAIELPFAHPGLYRGYGLRAPKGVLLYGPPGCGKTLIAKAVATCLADSAGGRPAAFLNIKGPELLSKFVGETERQIRAIFVQARKAAAEDRPVVVFFDEMEALLRTRGTGVSSDVETMIVPQVLSEIDGVESLRNVIVIGASNREDMIDPAILRPGRLDVRIRIDRPDREASRQILSRYLTEDLPIHPDELAAAGSVSGAVRAMGEALLDTLFSRSPDTAVLEVHRRSGAVETWHLADLVSGAMIASIVERAKAAAVKDALAGRRGLTTAHLLQALHAEVAESAELPGASDPEEWARVVGRGQRTDPVIALAPAPRKETQ